MRLMFQLPRIRRYRILGGGWLFLLANSCAAFSAGDLVIENYALSCLLFSEDFSEGTSDANSF